MIETGYRDYLIAAQLAKFGPELAVRPQTAADAAFCRALFHDARSAEFAQLGLSDQMLTTLLDQQFHAQRIGYAQNFPDAEYLMIEHAGAPVGRLIVALDHVGGTSADASGQDPLEIYEGRSRTAGHTLRLIDLSISTVARGRGIGTGVIEGLGCAARAVGARHITLSVQQTNDHARRLYERLGFVATGGEHHIQMSKPLT